MALNWLSGRRVEHPMSNMKKAREMADALPRNDSVRALEEVTSWLGSIHETADFKPAYRLELIDLIDQAAKSHWSKVAPEYLDAPRLQKLYEQRLWNTFFDFWKALGDAYLRCLRQFQAGDAGTAGLEKEMPRIVARALRALTVQIKWRLLRYEMVEDRIWQCLGATYLFAESRGFAKTQIAVYPGRHGDASAQEEFLKALLLAVSAPDALTPARLQIAERIVAHVARHAVLDATRLAGCGFYFDLAMHMPPARVSKSMRAAGSVRFFGAGDGRMKLHALATAINDKGAVPAEINLGGAFDKQTVFAVLMHLGRYWSDQPPARRAPRLDLVTRMTVVPGLTDSVGWIASSMDSDSLEFLEPQSAESWVVSNASDGGYGATVPTTQGDWLNIGALVGLHAEGANASRVGVLRRTTRDKNGERRVGIQVLSKVAIPVHVALAGGEKPAVPAGDANNAILLNTKPDDKGEIGLVMRAGSYLAGKAMNMRVRGKNYLLSPAAMIEEGEDFDWAGFKIVKTL